MSQCCSLNAGYLHVAWVLDYSVINSQDLTYEHLSILPNHDDETNPVLPFSIIPQHSAPGFGKFIMIVKNVIKGCHYNYLNPPFIPSWSFIAFI